MTKHKVAELTGALLDSAVAKAEGLDVLTSWATLENCDDFTGWILGHDGKIQRWRFDGSRSRAGHWEVMDTYTPSTDWAQAGPIMDRIQPHFEFATDSVQCELRPDEEPFVIQWGRDMREAAMRAHVRKTFGAEVEL